LLDRSIQIFFSAIAVRNRRLECDIAANFLSARSRERGLLSAVSARVCGLLLPIIGKTLP
jgi:hypothetical protein